MQCQHRREALEAKVCLAAVSADKDILVKADSLLENAKDVYQSPGLAVCNMMCKNVSLRLVS